MSILDGIIQGIIQGLTEFLPVSSSGHLSLYQYFTGNSGEGSLFFSLMLHLGTLAAVIAAYYEDLFAMLRETGRMIGEIFTGKFTFKTDNPDRKLLYMLVVACVPMLLVLPVHGLVSKVSGDGDIVVEGVCFLVTAAMLFMACRARRGKAGIGKMKARHAGVIGFAQAVAVMPGISRSGATTSAGLMMGFDRTFMVKFSFLLGIPSILGGAVVEIGDAVKEEVSIGFWPLFLGMLCAAVAGYACIRLVRWLVVTDKYIIFAWYTLILGVVVIVAGIVGHLSSGGAASGAAGSSSLAQGVSSAAAAVLPAGCSLF